MPEIEARAGRDPGVRRWTVAAAASVAALALVLALFRAPRPPAPPPARPVPAIVLAPALTDEAALFDPAPLFLPTDRNGTPRAPEPVPGDTFRDYPAKLVLPAEDLRLGLGPPIRVPASPVDALFANPPGNPLLGMGRTGAGVPQLSVRKAFVEVDSLATGRQVFAAPVPDASPPQPFGPDRRPIAYVALVGPGGLVGEPMPSTGSGSEALDGYFADCLVKTLRVGLRLPPGIYRISVGP